MEEQINSFTYPTDPEAIRRAETAEKVVDFMRRVHIYDYVKDLMDKEGQPEDFEKFKDFLVRLNGILRGIPINERSFDGENVMVAGWVDSHYFPRQEDKEDLLRYAYESVHRTKVGDEKYMMSAMINAVHMFNDGNGRLGRIVYQLLAGHSSEEKCLDEIKSAMLLYGRTETTNVNPEFLGKELEDIILKKYGWEPGVYDHIGEINGGIATAGPPSIEGIDEKHPLFKLIKEFSGCATKDMFYAISAIHKVLSPEQIHSVLIPGLRPVSLAKMAEILDEDQWKKLIDVYWQIKRDYVKTIVDIFVHPELYKTKDRDGVEVNVRDVFIEKINVNVDN